MARVWFRAAVQQLHRITVAPKRQSIGLLRILTVHHVHEIVRNPYKWRESRLPHIDFQWKTIFVHMQ